jgi:hypothetical protein
MRTTTFVSVAAAAIAALAACASKATGTDGSICSSGSGASVCLAKSTFDVSEAIDVQFAGGPGKPKDWVAVYPAGACNPTCPRGSTLWKYCATNTHSASDATVTSGSVTIDQAGNTSNWPLPPGNWEMLYLVDDGYSPIAKVSFTVAGTTPPGSSSSGSTCSNIGSCGPSSDNCKCGLSCLHIGEGRYTCGYSCSTAQDCASRTNPASGSAWNSCEPPHTGALDIPYEGYCY